MSTFLAAFLMTVLTASAGVNNPVYHYEPETVALTGTVEQQTFQGRPGYHSIQEGDEIESGLYFQLMSPIDVELLTNNADSNAIPEKAVKVLQLAPESDDIVAGLARLRGKKATLKGQLFHAITAHHHARVLMRVVQIGADKK